MFDRVVSLAFLFIGAGTIYHALQMPKPVFAGQIGPGVFPLGIGVLIVIISFLLFLEQRKNASAYKPGKKGWKVEFPMWISVAYILGFILILKIAGFVLSSFLLILLLGWQLGARKWIPLSLTALLFPGAIYLLFTQLGIVLP